MKYLMKSNSFAESKRYLKLFEIFTEHQPILYSVGDYLEVYIMPNRKFMPAIFQVIEILRKYNLDKKASIVQYKCTPIRPEDWTGIKYITNSEIIRKVEPYEIEAKKYNI